MTSYKTTKANNVLLLLVSTAALLCLTSLSVSAQEAESKIEAPVILRLQSDVAQKSETAVSEFWSRLSDSKTPVIEDFQDPARSWVTFFYRGNGATTGVQLNSAISASLEEGLLLEGGDAGRFKRLGDTNIWYLSLILPNELRSTYRLNVFDGNEKRTLLDPLAAKTYAPGSPWQESMFELSDAPTQHWRNHSADGSWQDIEIESKFLGEKTTINIYLPEGWESADKSKANVIIAMDGIGYREPLVPSDRIVEYLTERGEIPPTIIALTEDVSGVGDEHPMGYDPVASFLADEVLKLVNERFGVGGDPKNVVVTGKSRRGMISTYAAFKKPDRIGKVLSLSGSYYWKRPGDDEWESIPSLFARAPRKPLKLFLSAGIYERFVSVRNAGHYLLATNRHFRDVLTAKGYEFLYKEYPGTHRELNWEDQFVDGLRYLARGKIRTED